MAQPISYDLKSAPTCSCFFLSYKFTEERTTEYIPVPTPTTRAVPIAAGKATGAIAAAPAIPAIDPSAKPSKYLLLHIVS